MDPSYILEGATFWREVKIAAAQMRCLLVLHFQDLGLYIFC